MSMATRAIAAAAAAAARRSGLAASLSSCRGGGARSLSQSSAQRRQEDHQSSGDRHDATAAQVEASLNRKNVEVVQGDRSATLLADEAADALRGVGGGAEADDAWVPDQETGVFVPAEEAAASANGDGAGDGGQPSAGAPPSVLDQAVFVREEDMEDVERPAVDMASAHGGGAK